MIYKYKYKPLFYFSTMFLVTYALWFAGAYVSFRDESGLYMLLMLPGMMAPFLISLVLILTSKNSVVLTVFVVAIIAIDKEMFFSKEHLTGRVT